MICVRMMRFSYGIVMWEMLTKDLPHPGQTTGPLSERARSGQLALPIPESISYVYKELLRGKPTPDIGLWHMLTHVETATSLNV